MAKTDYRPRKLKLPMTKTTETRARQQVIEVYTRILQAICDLEGLPVRFTLASKLSELRQMIVDEVASEQRALKGTP